MAEIKPQRLSISASLQQSTAQWEAEIPGDDEYLDQAVGRTVDIAIGFKRPSGVPLPFVAIEDGPVDEWRLEARQVGGNISHLKGRDAAGKLFDTEFHTLYQRYPGSDVTVPDTTTVVIGVFRAKAVAETIIAAIGLSPVWQCRDYELWEDFDATGRAIDILRRLVQPWCSVQPRQVDIWCQGAQVILRERRPFPAASDHDFQFSKSEPIVAPVRRLRALNLNIRTEQLPIFGLVVLEGREEVGETPAPAFLSADKDFSSTNVEVIPFVRTVDENGGVTFTPGRVTQRSSSRMRANGQQVGRVETLSTYQMPNQVLLETRKNTFAQTTTGSQSPAGLAEDSVASGESEAEFAAALAGRVGATSGMSEERPVKREVKTIEYQEFTYDARGATNSPMQTREFNSVARFVSETDARGITQLVFKQDTEETTTYTYDRDNYLVTAITLKKVARDGALEADSLIVKHYQDTGPLSYTITTDRYLYEDETGFEAQFGQLVGGEFSGETGSISVQVRRRVARLAQTDETPCNGHRPGGPNRPATKPLTTDFSLLISNNVQNTTTVSGDEKAKSVARVFRNMSAEDLAYINAQHAECSGLFETELEFSCISVPWVKIGDIVEIFGVKTQGGGEHSFGKALIYDLALEVEFKPPRSHARIRAVSYRSP